MRFETTRRHMRYLTKTLREHICGFIRLGAATEGGVPFGAAKGERNRCYEY